jgi:GAF domain-containing protein
LETILEILFDQFHPDRAWCALREGLEGPMEIEAGRTTQGQALTLHDLELRQHVVQSTRDGTFLLLPQNTLSTPGSDLRSAMIAPLLEAEGSVGVLYVDNRGPGEHYGQRDLDYLVLLAIHIAAVFENF